MGRLRQFYITYASNQQVFYPGQVLAGQLVLEITALIEACGLRPPICSCPDAIVCICVSAVFVVCVHAFFCTCFFVCLSISVSVCLYFDVLINYIVVHVISS